MDRLQELMTFMDGLASDARLKPTHISLCIALYHAWVRSNFQNIFQISRRKLMAASRIQSKATYHKVIKDLQAFGYVKYIPSYHPVMGSSVGLVIRSFGSNQGVNKVSNDLAQGQAHF